MPGATSTRAPVSAALATALAIPLVLAAPAAPSSSPYVVNALGGNPLAAKPR